MKNYNEKLISPTEMELPQKKIINLFLWQFISVGERICI